MPTKFRRRLGAMVAVTGVVTAALHGGGMEIQSADGLWRARIDAFGQADRFFPIASPTISVLSEGWIYEANSTTGLVSRRVMDNYAVTAGPTIDKGGTHVFTRLEKSVGTGTPPSGNCCEERVKGGCEDAVCESAVCLIDCFCCDVVWDQTCADLAAVDAKCDCSPAPPPLAIEIDILAIDGTNGGILLTVTAINDSPADSITITLFGYYDLDIGSPQDDEVTTIFENKRLVALEQARFPDQDPLWLGGCPNYGSWQVGQWPAVRDILNGGVSQLPGMDTTTPGADDHSAALSTPTTVLGPGESLVLRYGIGAVDFIGCLGGDPCPWDLDLDGVIAITDLLALLAAWGPNPGNPADFDDDGIVAITDLLALLAAWGPC